MRARAFAESVGIGGILAAFATGWSKRLCSRHLCCIQGSRSLFITYLDHVPFRARLDHGQGIGHPYGGTRHPSSRANLQDPALTARQRHAVGQSRFKLAKVPVHRQVRAVTVTHLQRAATLSAASAELMTQLEFRFALSTTLNGLAGNCLVEYKSCGASCRMPNCG